MCRALSCKPSDTQLRSADLLEQVQSVAADNLVEKHTLPVHTIPLHIAAYATVGIEMERISSRLAGARLSKGTTHVDSTAKVHVR